MSVDFANGTYARYALRVMIPKLFPYFFVVQHRGPEYKLLQKASPPPLLYKYSAFLFIPQLALYIFFLPLIVFLLVVMESVGALVGTFSVLHIAKTWTY